MKRKVKTPKVRKVVQVDTGTKVHQEKKPKHLKLHPYISPSEIDVLDDVFYQ